MFKLGENSIGKSFLGSDGIGKAYLGTDLVFQKNSGSTVIPYIRGGGGNGSSYINTGITADNTVKIIVWARNWGPGAGQMFGSRTSSSEDMFLIGTYLSGVSTGRIQIAYNDNNSTYIVDQFHNLGGYHKYEYYQGKLKIDNIVAGSVSSGSFSNNEPIHLFGFNNGGTHANCSYKFDICKVQIWKNNVLVRYLVPVETPEAGFYDKVSDTTFTNSGPSGSILEYGTFDLSNYVPLQYIECSSSYINTGILGSYNLPIVAKLRPGSSSAAYRFLLGVRTSSSSGRCEFSIGDNSNIDRVFTFNYNQSAYSIYSAASQTEKDLTWIKDKNVSSLYQDATKLGDDATGPTDTSFTTDYPLYIGTLNLGGSASAAYFVGRIYYIGMGNSANFIPMKYNGVAGLYEMYSDTFYPSASSTPFTAGREAKNTHYFKNKRITIIGDSISTYDATGYKYDSYSMYYPAGNVDSVEKTYWKQLINGEEGTLVVNLSFSGSCAAHRSGGPAGGYPSLYDRASLIGNCDTVIIQLGTNDGAQEIPLGEYSYDKSISQLSTSNFREAYIKGIKQIMQTRPNAKIVCLVISALQDYASSVKEIADHYGLKYMRVTSAEYTKQAGVHPDYNGMRIIYRKLLTL